MNVESGSPFLYAYPTPSFTQHPRAISAIKPNDMSSFYRPEWTCGRHNKEKGVAILYNLIEGMCYLFEDESALVIGQILQAPRNGLITAAEIAGFTGIDIDCITSFLEQLADLHILTSFAPTKSWISKYRKEVFKLRQQTTINAEKTIKDKLPMAISTAEMDYMEKAGGVTSVMLELTYRCSEKCIHCYNIGATRNDDEKSGRENLTELSLNDYKRIIDQLYDNGLIKVCLSGGDPFSNPIIWDIIDYLYQRGIAFDVFTNGQLIEKDLDKLANYYPRLVGVSLYSGIAKVHDQITRIPGSWQRSMNIINRLAALSVVLEIKCCIMRPNVKSYYMVAEIANKLGATIQYEVNVTDSVDGDRCVSNYLRLTPKELEIVLRDDNIPLYVGKEAPNFGGQPRNLNNNACGAGYNTFCITPDGNLIPCCAFHMSFGNLRSNSVEDIVNNSVVKKWWTGLTLRQYEECGTHPYCDYCNLCAGCNYSEFNTPLKPAENNCYLAKNRYELANKLTNGQDPLNGKSLLQCLTELPDYENIGLHRIVGAH